MLFCRNKAKGSPITKNELKIWFAQNAEQEKKRRENSINPPVVFVILVHFFTGIFNVYTYSQEMGYTIHPYVAFIGFGLIATVFLISAADPDMSKDPSLDTIFDRITTILPCPCDGCWILLLIAFGSWALHVLVIYNSEWTPYSTLVLVIGLLIRLGCVSYAVHKGNQYYRELVSRRLEMINRLSYEEKEKEEEREEDDVTEWDHLFQLKPCETTIINS